MRAAKSELEKRFKIKVKGKISSVFGSVKDYFDTKSVKLLKEEKNKKLKYVDVGGSELTGQYIIVFKQLNDYINIEFIRYSYVRGGTDFNVGSREFKELVEFLKEEKVKVVDAEKKQIFPKSRMIESGSCCIIGLLPTTILFLPFMTILPNEKILFSFIDIHQKNISPNLNKHNFRCGFTPSCSEYSKMAIRKYGAFKGGLKSLLRMAKCNPLNKNKGIDYP